MEQQELTTKEVFELLEQLYMDKAEYDEELKINETDALAKLPEDTSAKKMKKIVALAKKSANGKFMDAKADTELTSEILEELE